MASRKFLALHLGRGRNSILIKEGSAGRKQSNRKAAVQRDYVGEAINFQRI